MLIDRLEKGVLNTDFADRTDFGRKEFQKRLKEPKEKNKDSKKETSKKGKVEEVTKVNCYDIAKLKAVK